MTLWVEVVRCIRTFSGACRRKRTFLWMAVVLIAWVARPDLLGVTSFVRASFLEPSAYPLLLNFFHSRAVVIPLLLERWVLFVLDHFSPVKAGEYLVLVADGLKVAKEGRKMPAVKCLHQESENNSKPEYIMGHSCQVIALLVGTVTGQILAVPLLSRICEGVLFERASRRKSLLDKLAGMFLEVAKVAAKPCLLVADAYYASRKIIGPLLARGHQLISRVRRNAVAFQLPPKPKTRTRGRPKKYGLKVRLRDLFKGSVAFVEAPSPVYGEGNITIRYRSVDLLWRPVGTLVRFVLVKHPLRGNIILLSTCLTLDALDIIRIYGLRFKIEVSFKQALHTLGAYAYHFWMMTMTPISWGSGNQNIQSRPDDYQRAVARKIDAYHRYIQLGCIAQGLLQHLAVNFRDQVWLAFRSWLRTMRTDLVPSELVVAQALRIALPEFLLDSSRETEIKKFILDHADADRIPGVRMAA